MRVLLACMGRWGLLALLAGLLACQPTPAPPAGRGAGSAGTPLATRFGQLLDRGDSLYAEKKGYRSFIQAQRYYDSARILADRSGDTLLLAEAIFAKARVYDAWNQQPHKTVEYFKQAADLFARRPAAWRRYFYARYLVAHAYDKIPDSLRTVQALRHLRAELLARPDSVRRQVPSTVEMALTATEVHNYPLADSLLRQLVHRPAVHNDPETYNYLDHYFLTQARLDVHYRHPRTLAYLDSLRAGYRCVRNPFDRVYYTLNLSSLYAATGQYTPAYRYLRLSRRLQDSLDIGGDVAQVRQTLVQSEERAAQRQRQYEAARQRTRTRGLWGLSISLAIITLLSFYLYYQQRRSHQQARALAHANAALADTNTQLDEQVAQVALLNKEIKHRVKNNLHMVYSLLHMQERRTDNEEVIAHLQAARLRVESIAALHSQFLNNPDTGPDLAVYLRGLISSVVSCLANDRQVVTHLQTLALPLPPTSYLPLSLILNEWVTNSIKYADTGSQLLEIAVSVRHDGPHTYLNYADNGTPPDPQAVHPGLGTQIITLLTRQLSATLRTLPGQPFRYELYIPAAAHAL